MSHLLAVMRLRTKAMQQKGNVPLMVEFTVSEETAPYLVSSSSSVMWINAAHPGPVVKAAVRQVTISDFYAEVVDEVASMGRLQQWGNVQPLTHEGMQAAIDHINFYELGSLELLIPRSHPAGGPIAEKEGVEGDEKAKLPELMPPELRPFIEETGLPFRSCSWLPDSTIVVVPRDRTFVGIVSRVTPKRMAAVVHNSARGIAVVQGIALDELAGKSPASAPAD